MEQIQASATFLTIAAADFDEFEQLAAEVLDAARSEPGTLQFDWFLSADRTQCVVRETYADSDAVLAHIANVGPLLSRLVPLGGGIKIELFGDLSATLREAMAPFGPTIYSFSQGK